MKRIKTAAGALVGFVVVSSAAARADDRTVNVAVERRTGDKTRGPATITLTRVNVLRYDVLVGVGVTFAGGPDLTVPFIPPVTAPAAREKPEQPETGATAGDPIRPILSRLDTLEQQRIKNVQAVIANLIDRSNLARQTIDALLESSDGALRMEKGPEALVAGAKTAATQIKDALGPQWPTPEIMNQLATLAGIRVQLAGVSVSTLSADQKRTFAYIETRVSDLEKWYASVDAQSEAARTARTAQGKLAAWSPIMESLAITGPAAFTLPPVVADCGFTFGGTKESKIELVKRDRLAAPGTAETREEIITVVCSSPFSVSAGFGVSGIDQDVIGLVPSTKTSVVDGAETIVSATRFGYTERSGYRALPLVLVNTRLYEWNDALSAHLSAGAGVGTDGKTGNDIEYMLGGSIGFKRDILITVGWHFAHTHTLAGGFAIDDEVPEGVSEPPLEKKRDGGLMLAVTFKVR